MNKVLIIGATSGTGLLIAKKLLARNIGIRIIARNQEKAKRLFGKTEAEIVVSDLTTPNPEFYKAFKNLDHIFFTAAVPPGIANEDQIREVDYMGVVYALQAAKEANFTGRFYYMNTIGCYHSSWFIKFLGIIKKNLIYWRIEAEHAIRNSTFQYTIIRAGILNNSKARRSVRVFNGDIPISLLTHISRDEVANIFVSCMQIPSTIGKDISIIWGKTHISLGMQLANLNKQAAT